MFSSVFLLFKLLFFLCIHRLVRLWKRDCRTTSIFWFISFEYLLCMRSLRVRTLKSTHLISCPTTSTNSVNISFSNIRNIEINNILQAINVNTPCSNISSYQHPNISIFKLLQCSLSCILCLVAVYRSSCNFLFKSRVILSAPCLFSQITVPGLFYHLHI